jgi:hypothetical protein
MPWWRRRRRRADQDRCAIPMLVGDLRQRLVGHADVVGCGIGVRVPGSQHPRQRLAGVVQPSEQGVKAEPMLVGGRTAAARRSRRGPATPSPWRPPARRGPAGRGAPPGRRSRHRRRRASPPDQPTPGPAHAPSDASDHRRPRRRMPHRQRGRGTTAGGAVHACGYGVRVCWPCAVGATATGSAAARPQHCGRQVVRG